MDIPGSGQTQWPFPGNYIYFMGAGCHPGSRIELNLIELFFLNSSFPYPTGYSNLEDEIFSYPLPITHYPLPITHYPVTERSRSITHSPFPVPSYKKP
ncbi:hypothetical protein PL9631_540056 [Planktothrix paucivesiculata PCC 9631]|uniref:Uncharacterized protein n=1 Tax=Planktothrix paucivesiculata PCC 9631 TaxID=671071 RepID=A0A7Z9BTX0_9CYAN|nr:hypothetical protein PL9631_540056 [Planktothrix paucivesiculata PCC 9631]